MAQLTIESERKPGYSANMVARSAKQPSTVVICAHLDTKFDTPGALDNGSGLAVLLALAQTLDKADYPFALELVAFTNEEYFNFSQLSLKLLIQLLVLFMMTDYP